MPISLLRVYRILLEHYGPQGWWPVARHAGEPGFDENGYHPNIWGMPETVEDRWEILTGAILTQNTSWKNVELALVALRAEGISAASDVLSLTESKLASLIRPSGYYNQKAKRLRSFAAWLNARPNPADPPARKELLSLVGIGPETADSMLLYAWNQPVFVVDLYTIRLLTRLSIITTEEIPMQPVSRYEHVQKSILSRLSRSPVSSQERLRLYTEMHALIVYHAKEHCAARPKCAQCPLGRHCPNQSSSP